MALMLALLRRVPDANASVQAGEWERGRYTGRELRGKTLGIIGLGKIGRAVARRVAGFEMRVLASDPYLTEEQAAEAGAKLVGMAELLHRSDVITVHTPLTAQTRHLLGRAQLDATKPGAFVLNVARGGIVDESALADALSSGHLAGAAVDVYSTEPMASDNPLRGAPNLVLTPHLGASTAEAQDRVGLEMAEQVLMALGRDAPVCGQRPVGRRPRPRRSFDRMSSSAGARAPRPPTGAERLRRDLADLCRRDRRRRVRTDPNRGRGRDPRGGHRPARERRQRGPRRPRSRPDGPRDSAPARRSRGRPSSSCPSVRPTGSRSLTLAGSTAHGRPHLASVDGFEIDAELAGDHAGDPPSRSARHRRGAWARSSPRPRSTSLRSSSPASQSGGRRGCSSRSTGRSRPTSSRACGRPMGSSRPGWCSFRIEPDDETPRARGLGCRRERSSRVSDPERCARVGPRPGHPTPERPARSPRPATGRPCRTASTRPSANRS